MTDYSEHIPGENEYSMIDSLIGNLEAARMAKGEIDGYDASVSASYERYEDGRAWKLTVYVRGAFERDSWNRYYATRVDAYAAFEWYLDQHEELEEVEATNAAQSADKQLEDLHR